MEIVEPNLLKLEIETIPQTTGTYCLSEQHKTIFLKYLKYDFRVASNNNKPKSLWRLMIEDLNYDGVTNSEDIWFELLKSWMNYVKMNAFSESDDQTNDNILKQMIHDKMFTVPTSAQISCILDHIETMGEDSTSTWEAITAKLGIKSKKMPDRYWMKVYNKAKERIIIREELLDSMRRKQIEITDDFELTENDNRLLHIIYHSKSSLNHLNAYEEENECRICLERGTGLINLFRQQHETPSLIEKLLECSRITQISEADGFPQTICRNCLNQLEIAFQFRILSEISEHKLRLRSRTLPIVDDKSSAMPDEMVTCDDDQSVLNNVNSINVDDESESDKSDRNSESWDLKLDITNEKNEKIVVLHQCETCGLTFDSSKLLKKHIRCHIVAPIASRECKICSKIFKSEALLRAHGRTHSDLRPYICETCGKAFKTTSQLASHCLTHSDVKNYQCPHCSYRGNTNNNLQIHLRTHSRVQPYSCRFCQWKFSTASNMQKHIRNIHHKMRTHQCNECEKSFFAKESLRKHMVTHSGIKMYSCSVCSSSYAWYNGLKKHMRIQHVGEKCPSEITFRPTKTMC